MKKMKVTLHKDGTTTVEALDFTGPDCLTFTAEMEKRLGTPIGERVLKPEFHETETEQEREHEVER